MQSTSRLRVLSDRIPRVLVFVYFSRGLSGNTEERPTRRDYIEILTSRKIILHLESPEATGTNGRLDGLRGRAPALPPWAPALARSPIRTLFRDYAPPT